MERLVDALQSLCAVSTAHVRKKGDAMSHIDKSLWSEAARLPRCWNCTVVNDCLPKWRHGSGLYGPSTRCNEVSSSRRGVELLYRHIQLAAASQCHVLIALLSDADLRSCQGCRGGCCLIQTEMQEPISQYAILLRSRSFPS